MTIKYNDPAGGTPSSIGTQFNLAHWNRKSIIEARKKSTFMQTATVANMPKHMGKTMEIYEYIPLLDDRNINDQGIDATGAAIVDGNLFGSPKDAGKIVNKMPTISEDGGRVNRVGFTREVIRGSIQELGFFSDYTENMEMFDTDAGLLEHLSRETINGAYEVSEIALQVDLLNNAGVVLFPGIATSPATITIDDVVDINDLLNLSKILTDNKTPKHTNIITGTRYIDTATINGSRVLYCGSELVQTLYRMKDFHGEKAFIPIEKYAAGTTLLENEIGAVQHFRIVEVPDMLAWEGAGEAIGMGMTNNVVYSEGGRVNVYPMLCVGDGSFSTIGFQTDGKTMKFRQIHRKPGEMSADLNNPYGKKGFMSISWWYGFLAQRPERLGLIKTAALQ